MPKFLVELGVFDELVSVKTEDGLDADEYEVAEIFEAINKKRPAYIYFVDFSFAYKIGFAIDVQKRVSKFGEKDFRYESAYEFRCVYEDRSLYERHIHRYFMEQGKWYKGEFFYLTQDDMCEIYKYENASDFCKDHPLTLDWSRYGRLRDVKEMYKIMYVFDLKTMTEGEARKSEYIRDVWSIKQESDYLIGVPEYVIPTRPPLKTYRQPVKEA